LVKIVANASLKHFLCGLKLKKKTCGGSDFGILYQRKNNQIVEHPRNIQAKLHLIHFPTESYVNSAPWQQPS
jgi:hypothetical protein